MMFTLPGYSGFHGYSNRPQITATYPVDRSMLLLSSIRRHGSIIHATAVRQKLIEPPCLWRRRYHKPVLVTPNLDSWSWASDQACKPQSIHGPQIMH